MLDYKQLKTLVVIPALHDLVLLSDAAVELILFTCAAESKGGTYIHQSKGHALGIYNMLPVIYNDIWQNYIRIQQSIRLQLLYNFLAPVMPSEERLIYDLRFATAMARIHYARAKEPLPDAKDVDAIYDYYKTFYNSRLDTSDKSKLIADYFKFKN